MSNEANIEIKNDSQNDDLQNLIDPSFVLLKEFRDACPGTYKHAQAVSSMVEGVSIALELNVIEMKVAAVYHDIGKMVNPKIFTENQLDNESPHDDLDPWVSFQLISRHVGDSVNILLNNGFPRNIIEIISQHHGNGIVSYFYNKSGSKNENHYRYHCAKPNCVESAVLCICDHVEATSRSKYQANKFDPVSVIEDTINDLINDGQLDDVLIRLGDLKKIKTTLAKELEGTYQKRVDYEEAKKTDSEEKGDKNNG